MFVMDDTPRFDTEATGKMPGDNGEAFSFRPTFLALGASELGTYDLSNDAGTVAFLNRVLVGMGDVLDAGGQPVPFTDATRDWLIDKVHTRVALVKAYFAAVYGATLGN